jgi:hypothetical protein
VFFLLLEAQKKRIYLNIMEKFQFENYRDELAKELRETRSKDGGRKDAKGMLESVKNSEDYQDTKKLHQIRNEFPRQAVAEAMNYPKQEDDPALWDVEDVSGKIPEEYKYTVDKAILYDISNKVYPSMENNKERWAVDEKIAAVRREKPESEDVFEGMREAEEEKKKIENFLDSLSGHRLLDKHNLNHLVMGHGGTAEHYRAKAFDRHSKIEASSHGEFSYSNGFWMNIAGGNYVSIGNPAVIFSPDNIATRRFFENKFYPPIDNLLEKFSEDEKKSPGSTFLNIKKKLVFEDGAFKGFNISSYNGEPDLARILFLAGFPFAPERRSGKAIFFPFESEYEGKLRREENDHSKVPIEESWADISDCIIDLRVRKVWKRKYSEDEIEQVKSEKEKYKKWIENNLLNCTFEELIRSFEK